MHETKPPFASPVELQWCPRCERGVARERCRTIRLGDEEAWACPDCDGLTRAVATAEHRALAEVYRTAWRYPLAGDGRIALGMLAAGTWLMGHVRIWGIVVSFGMLAAYAFSIVKKTADGEDALPAPTDFIDWTDFFRPALRALAAGLVALAPWLLVLGFGGSEGAWLLLHAAALAFAVVWLPASVISATYSDSIVHAMNPVPAVVMMRRIPRDYALTVGVLWAWALAGAALTALAQVVAGLITTVPIVPSVAAEACSLYVPLVMARTLGLLLRERRLELGLDV